MSNSNKVEIILPDPQVLVPTKDQGYADVIGLMDFMGEVEGVVHLILSAPKGVGKTMGVVEYATRKGIPIVERKCSSGTKNTKLDGHFILKGDQTPWLAGDFQKAIHVANDMGVCIYLLEEINALQNERQKDINQIAHDHVAFYADACETLFELDEGCIVWVIGTMNPSTYGGVHALNEDLKSRFQILEMDYPESSAETEILNAQVSGADPDLVKQAIDLAQATRSPTFKYSLAPRDLVQFLKVLPKIGKERALKLLEGKFPEQGKDRPSYRKLVMDKFTVNLDDVSVLKPKAQAAKKAPTKRKRVGQQRKGA